MMFTEIMWDFDFVLLFAFSLESNEILIFHLFSATSCVQRSGQKTKKKHYLRTTADKGTPQLFYVAYYRTPFQNCALSMEIRNR